MAKPASGTGLDTGSSLYSVLTAVGSAVWGLLEGSGSTSADSSGNGHTLTPDATATWSTNGAGEAILACSGTSGNTCPITSPIALASTSAWSFAFRLKVNVTATYESVFGASNNDLLVNDTSIAAYRSISGAQANFTSAGAIDWVTDADWLLTVDGLSSLKVRLYHNGTEVGDSPKTIAAGDSQFTFSSLGSPASTFQFAGTLTYGYLMNGYVATGTDASNLHSNPYFIFSTGGGGGKGSLWYYSGAK